MAVVIDVIAGTVETLSERPVLAEWAPSSDAIYYFELGGTFHPRPLGDFYIRRLEAADPVKLMGKEYRDSSRLMMKDTRWSMSLSPDGSMLAIGGYSSGFQNGYIYLYNLEQGATVDLEHPFRKFEDAPGLLVELDWAPDAKSLAAVLIVRGLAISVLDINSGAWKTLVTIPAKEPGATFVEYYAFGVVNNLLSWAR